MGKKLTAKEESYIRHRIEGYTQTAAYDMAYTDKGGSRATRARSAYKVENKPYISPIIEAANKRIAEHTILNAEQRQAILTDIIASESESAGTKIKAIKTLNDMQGSNAPTQAELSISSADRTQAAMELIKQMLEN